MLGLVSMFFLSHTWCKDDNNRDTHARVASVKHELCSLGAEVWFDEDRMAHDIDACMANGINECAAVVIFVTRRYCDKVNHAARRPDVNDNCYKEFSYAHSFKKRIIPVVFEESMSDPRKWPPGIVRMHLATKMMIFACDTPASCTASDILVMDRRLQRLSETDKVPSRRAPVLKRVISVQVPQEQKEDEITHESKEVQVSPTLWMSQATHTKPPSFVRRILYARSALPEFLLRTLHTTSARSLNYSDE